MKPAALALTIMMASAFPVRADLLGADELLKRIEKGATAESAQRASPAAALLDDIRRFRANAPTLNAKQAAEAWMALYERAERLGSSHWQGDTRTFDAEIGGGVGVQSVLASLPAPAAWPLLREAARARAKKAPAEARALALQQLTELLVGDRLAAAATLAAIDRLADRLPPQERDQARAEAAAIRATVARLYGTPQEIAASFVASLEMRTGRGADVAIPDLAGLVGPAQAEAILRAALSKPVSLHVPEGLETRTLARRLALEQLAGLRVAQWGLVDGVEAAGLYEALTRKFPAGGEGFAGHKREADTYYFLHLVIAGRHADAEEALARIAGKQSLYLPKRAVEALQRAGHNEALFRFLHALLKRRPELRAWDLYTREAAYTGHSAEVIALVDELLGRKDLPAYVRADLRIHRINALLAADKVEPGLAALRELLAAGPARGEGTARADAAIRLAGLGRILERHELTDSGLAFAREVLKLPAEDREQWERGQLLRKVFAEERKLGMLDRAQALAIAELERAAGQTSETEAFGMPGGPSDARVALVELAALYGQAKRHRDVVVLLNESTKWGARDLRELLSEKDSLEVPLALTAANALAATGDVAAALAVARALVDELPGYDPAYELVARLDKDASRYLDGVYARDQFQERPLIWKAIVLSREGRHLEAESLIRSAIVIDPSDGEEGPNDRMRAYAVLADILEARGATSQAAGFRRAVAAIRVSERSDELHKLGLYERAFAGYREALGHFADAYCIQSRLAVRLHEQGRRQEAFEHYRRAYELMPSSFGRVESHCFGCESVFAGPDQQRIAEQVFSDLLKKDATKPQAHYLLGYLYKERGRNAEGLKYFRAAVSLDPDYLNAWKHLHELGSRVYIEARERDLARLKLLELDPQQRHVRYDLDSVGDLAVLWRAVEAASAKLPPAAGSALYRLRRSAGALDAAMAKLPEAMREQVLQYQAMAAAYSGRSQTPLVPRQIMARHALVKAIGPLLGAREEGFLR
jgi:tetratricopeptide (TPR) repeat protein